MTTGELISVLVDKGALTAETDPGRRKQVERALTSDAALALGVRRLTGQFGARGGGRGRPARVAWLIEDVGEERPGRSRAHRLLAQLNRGFVWRRSS
jgi:hypothetical protein